jgi:hypothetical protein
VSTAGELTACRAVPEADVTVADVTVALPGHQARNRPPRIVVTTCVPSLSTKAAADTPEPAEPSATVIRLACGGGGWLPSAMLNWVPSGPLMHRRPPCVPVFVANSSRVKGPRVSATVGELAP